MIGVNARRETNYTRDEQLLRRYVETGSDQAFAEIVGEYMPLVYAACLRELPDSSVAQDAAQVVFIVLACRAASIRNGRALASWLFRTACLTARDMLKRERRRQSLERQLTTEALHGESAAGEWDRALWNRLEPALDDALLSLGSADRECVLLHYIVGYNLREVGALLHISEDAARKRTARALEKMRRFMNRKDAVIATAALAGLLAGYRANAQPLLPDLLKTADQVAAHAVGRAAGPPQLIQYAQGVLKTMTLAKIQAIAGITAVVALAAGGIGLAHTGTLGSPFGRIGKPTTPATGAGALSARSARAATAGVPTTVKTNAKDGAQMALIPSGKFRMGSTMAEIDAINQEVTNDFFKSEGPEHDVSLDAYFIYRTPVTVAQYMRFCDETGHRKPAAPDFNPNWSRKDHPIVNATYEDALAYCKWASGNRPGSVRLPTEAEWEKAARGGLAGARYPWGSEFDAGRLWCSKQVEDDAGGTQAVASFAPNGYGLYDMAGNVWQWCSDWFDAGFYASALATKPNPENRNFGAMKARVVRGGSWGDFNPLGFRCAGRIFSPPLFADKHFGFRCVSVKSK